MARNFGVPSRSRGSLPPPRFDSKRLRQIETALSHDSQERAFRTAEALQHVADPWGPSGEGKELVDAIWAKNDRDWYKLLAIQLGLVAALFLALIMVLR